MEEQALKQAELAEMSTNLSPKTFFWGAKIDGTRVVATKNIEAGQIIHVDTPILSYKYDPAVPERVFYTLMTLNDETISGLLAKCETLYPRTLEDRMSIFRQMHSGQPHEIITQLVKQPPHIIAAVTKCNGFDKYDMRFLYVGATRLNHSCYPNCLFRITEDGKIVIRVVRPILAGEECTISYFGGEDFQALTTPKERREYIRTNLLFICMCDVCMGKTTKTFADFVEEARQMETVG